MKPKPKRRRKHTVVSPPRRRGGPFAAAGRALDSRTRGMGPFEAIGRVLETIGAGVFLALTVTNDEVRAAGGSFVEAMHGHKCGPDCWHAIGTTAAERQAWWDEKMRACDAAERASRETFWKNIGGEPPKEKGS